MGESDHPVEAYSPAVEPTEREAVTEQAETEAFLRGLRAERNAKLVRDGMVAGIVGALLGVAVALGPSTQVVPPLAASAPDLEVPPPTSSAPASSALADHVDGPLQETDLAHALAAQQSEISRCFALAAAPSDGDGTVTVAFLVSEKGRVMDVADLGSKTDRTVVRCVARSMRGLSLPAVKGSTVVRHSFAPRTR